MKHDLKILSLGNFPAAVCSCKWGMTFTHRIGDTKETKRERLEAGHREHVNRSARPASGVKTKRGQ